MNRKVFLKLTECEELVIKTIWDAGEELNLMEIMSRVNNKYHKTWKPQTVSTFLARMVRKGYLRHYRQGRVFFYQILVPFEEYRQQVSKEFVDFWYGGSSPDMDMRIALEAYNTLRNYCCAQKDREGGCRTCLLSSVEDNEEYQWSDCIMENQDIPKNWQELDLD